jgi:hypothetical protein
VNHPAKGGMSVDASAPRGGDDEMGLNGVGVNEEEIARTPRSRRARKPVAFGKCEQWAERKRAQSVSRRSARLSAYRTERQRDQPDAIHPLETATVEAERHSFQSERGGGKPRTDVTGHAGFA